MSRVLVKDITQRLKALYEGGLWLNESFKQKIDGLSENEAMTRPIPEIHSVAELVSHVLVWRIECMRRLNGLKTDLMNSPENWKTNHDLSKMGWAYLTHELYKSQAELIQTITNLDDRDLETQIPGTGHTMNYLIQGIFDHDLYHLGQIGITIKFLRMR